MSMDVKFAKVDANDSIDIIVANRGSQNRILINNGSGIFVDETSSRIGSDSDSTFAVEVGDVDGNGTPDLFFANNKVQNRLFLNNGLGVFTESTVSSLPAYEGDSTDALFVNVDGDSDLDLFVAEGSGGVHLFENDGNGIFTDVSSTNLPNLNDFVIKIDSKDINFDGAVDILLSSAGQDRLFINDGNGAFTDDTANQLPLDTSRSFGNHLLDGEADLDFDAVIAKPRQQNQYLKNDLSFPRLVVSVSPETIEIGDTVTISVIAFDENGIDSINLDVNGDPVLLSSGVGTYVPSTSGDHTATAIAVDNEGKTGNYSVFFSVFEKDNASPTVSLSITTAPPILEGQSVGIQVLASDDRGIVSRNLTINGNSVPIDVNGNATYQTIASGLHTIEAQVFDAAGNQGTAAEMFTVDPDTEAPEISISATPNPIDLLTPITISVSVTDNVGVVSTVATLTGPGEPSGKILSFDLSGQTSYTPFASGIYTVEVRSLDAVNNEGTESMIFETQGELEPDFVRPEVTVTSSSLALNVGNTALISVNVVDDVFIVSRELLVNGEQVELGADGTAAFSSEDPGVFLLEARAIDPLGNEGYDSEEIRFLVPGDTIPPVISISTPGNFSKFTEPADVIGSVNDTNLLLYKLEYSPKDKNEFVTIASDNTSKTDEVLGTFDPTMLRNGLYDVRLTAEDEAGNTSSIIGTYQADGEAKVGNFTISFEDLTIPVAGIPITITRSYDSRVKTKGDFGIGWKLDLSDIEVSESGILGKGWQQLSFGFLFSTFVLQPTVPHIVTVTFPDGKTHEFGMVLNPNSSFLFPFGFLAGTSASFTPSSGTFSSLVSLDNNSLSVSGSVNPVELVGSGLLGGSLYDPDRYQFTDVDGIEYVINQDSGLESITEPNGNTITFSSDGIIHSAGKSVLFDRDSEGRITTITDPMGNTIEYEYDFYGDLVAVTDQEGNQTQFGYNSNHGLLDIINPNGVMAARNEFNDEGRLTAVIDSHGNRLEFSFDIEGREEVIRDRLGNITVRQSDEQGNVISETDALGNTKSFTYDANDNVLSETDPLGNVITYTYDGNDNLASRTDPLGNVETFTYNSFGQVLVHTDARGGVTTNTYDVFGNLISTMDPENNLTEFANDSAGNLLSQTDAQGSVTEMEYDSFGYLVRKIDPLGNETEFSYDENGKVLSETRFWTVDGNHELLVTSFLYDSLGRQIQKTYPDGSILNSEYDEVGNLIATIDELGRTTTHNYDDLNRQIRATFPDGTITENSYDFEGRVIAITDQERRTTNLEYDALGRLTRTEFQDGSTQERSFDPSGRLISFKDENNNTHLHQYDRAGQRTKEIDPTGRETEFVYDEVGNVVSITDSLGRAIHFEYDGNHFLTKTLFPDGTEETFSYDDLSRLISVVDQEGRETRYSYDEASILDPSGGIYPSRISSVTDALNQVWTFDYDEVGNRIRQTNSNGNITRWEYDKRGRVIRRTLPLGMSEDFTYDVRGNLVSHKDFNGSTTTFEYNAVEVLTSKTFPNTSSDSFTYNPSGSLATVTDERGITTFTYDNRFRLVNRIDPDGTEISYTYDAVGNKETVSTPSGITTYTYDPLNRISGVIDIDGNVTTYEYNEVGLLVSTVLPNETYTEYDYDSLNRLTKVENFKPDSTVLSTYQYTLDASGKRLSVTENDSRTIEYEYDAIGRLIQEKLNDPLNGLETIAYTYDAVGNRLTKTDDNSTITYSYDANDRVLRAGVRTYTYDNNGNTILLDNGGLVTTYNYDFEDQLISAETPDHSLTFTYDNEGIRVGSTINGAQTHYLVDDNRDLAQVLEERDEAGSLLAAYTIGIDLISQTREGASHYYHYDGIGSTRALTDGTATVTDSYSYESFGEIKNRSGPSENRYLFAGEQYDSELELYYLRARYLDPNNGRFFSEDPVAGIVEQPWSLHRFSYTHNDPINFVDPSGEIRIRLGRIKYSTSRIVGRRGIRSGRRIKVANGRIYRLRPSKGGTGPNRWHRVKKRKTSGHGNLRSNPNPSIAYKIKVRDVNGTFRLRKLGITSRKPNALGKYSRPQSQVKKLEKIYGKGNVRFSVHRRFANRAQALNYEKAVLGRYFRLFGHYPGQRIFLWGRGSSPGSNLINR